MSDQLVMIRLNEILSEVKLLRRDMNVLLSRVPETEEEKTKREALEKKRREKQ